MAHCYYHALSSVRKWGGTVDDYLPLHQWFDQSKAILADPRHRALRHHAEGIFMLETLFGETLVNADGRVVPVRLVGEQHVREDLGSIPSFADWARLITPQAWMLRGNPLDGAEGVTIDMPVRRSDRITLSQLGRVSTPYAVTLLDLRKVFQSDGRNFRASVKPIQS